MTPPKKDRKVALQKLYTKCKYIGAAYSQEIGEDFPGWAVSQVMAYNHFIPIKWLLATYLRDKLGAQGAPSEVFKKHSMGIWSKKRFDPTLDGVSRGSEGGRSYFKTAGEGGGAAFKLPNQLKTVEKPWIKADWEGMLGYLPERLRVPIVCKEKWGMNNTEVAEVLGVSEGTVGTRIKDAKRILRAIWDHAEIH